MFKVGDRVRVVRHSLEDVKRDYGGWLDHLVYLKWSKFEMNLFPLGTIGVVVDVDDDGAVDFSTELNNPVTASLINPEDFERIEDEDQ